jgi:hypothetical protein
MDVAIPFDKSKIKKETEIKLKYKNLGKKFSECGT